MSLLEESAQHDFEFVAAPSVRTPEGFHLWRVAHGLSQRKLAALLDQSWTTISRYENGHLAISRVVELALEALDHRIGPSGLALEEDAENAPAEPDHTAETELILSLCREAGDDVSNVVEVIEDFQSNHHPDDIAAAAGGDLRALIRLRKACGLRAFR